MKWPCYYRLMNQTQEPRLRGGSFVAVALHATVGVSSGQQQRAADPGPVPTGGGAGGSDGAGRHPRPDGGRIRGSGVPSGGWADREPVIRPRRDSAATEKSQQATNRINSEPGRGASLLPGFVGPFVVSPRTRARVHH